LFGWANKKIGKTCINIVPILPVVAIEWSKKLVCFALSRRHWWTNISWILIDQRVT